MSPKHAGPKHHAALHLVPFHRFILYATGTGKGRCEELQQEKRSICGSEGRCVSYPGPPARTEPASWCSDLSARQPAFKNIELREGGKDHRIASALDPAFILTVGKRDLGIAKRLEYLLRQGSEQLFKRIPGT